MNAALPATSERPGVLSQAAGSDPLPSGARRSLDLAGYGVLFGRNVVLADVTCSIPADGTDVLMGPVRTGKSTLLRSICGLNDNNSQFRQWGHVRVGAAGFLQRPALVQQHAALLQGCVQEGVIQRIRHQGGRTTGEWLAHARHLLEFTGLGHLVPFAREPLLSIAQEWQRAVNILSWAATQPPLLFVDEPTYGLEDLPARRLLDWLGRLGQTVKLVVALHHQGHARQIADRILLLGGGRVIAHQGREAFFERPANELVRHFVTSGSLPIASPNANASDLESGAVAELPRAARQALREFHQAADEPVLEADAGADAQTAADTQAVTSRPASLPMPLEASVDEASMVGRVVMPEYRGPRGFHWIVRGRLAGCPEPGIAAPIGYDLELLRSVGITYLITLTENNLDAEVLDEYGLKNLHLPIFDREAPSIAQAYMLLVKMQALMARQEVLAVHCKAGIGRTGTILGAWLIRDGGLSASTAIQRLRMINPSFVQTEVQERFLARLEQDLICRV